MSADYRERTGRAPRTDYGPRKLLPVNSNTKNRRFYGKDHAGPINDNGKDESLPRGWSILEPNRVKERRIAAGFPSASDLSLHIGTMSYQRLKKIENGRVVVRASEYELIAKAMGIAIHYLQLPMLMRSQTVEWMERWGADNTIEEGGDHDAVLLAAYVRYHVHRLGLNKSRACIAANVPGNALHFIWHAAKPIDRYPDTTMKVAMMISNDNDWNEVIANSQNYYLAGDLKKFILDVQKPRVRYAPEDPSKMAPWTYDTDPFRTRQPRERYVNAYSSTKRKARYNPKQELTTISQKREVLRIKIRYYRDIRMIVRIARTIENPVAMLVDKCPDQRKEIEAIKDEAVARQMLLRLLLVRYAIMGEYAFTNPMAKILRTTGQRVRQLVKAYKDKGLMVLKPAKSDKQFTYQEPEWEDFRHQHMIKITP